MANIICPHCGITNRIGSNFCNRCGTDLRDVGVNEEPASATPPSIAQAARRAAEQLTAREASPRPETEAAAPDSTAMETEPQQPLFDLGLASPEPGEEADQAAEQSWLGSDTAEEKPPSGNAPDQDPIQPDLAEQGGRLVSGIQGLLDPLSIVGNTAEPLMPRPPVVALTMDDERWVQQLMCEEPVVVSVPMAAPGGDSSLRVGWIFGLLALAVLFPLLFNLAVPTGTPRRWPGVTDAYHRVENLPNGADVIVYWAYDPATAGELDLVARPVIEHLITKQADLVFVSQLPTGPATAARLVAQSIDFAGAGLDSTRLMQRITAHNIFLPGGAAVLPLLGAASVAPMDPGFYGAALRGDMAAPQLRRPELAVLIAAQAEDVQHWLEMVQPVNRVAAIAVTSAAADPIVRAYQDSGQLRGLVSGFDGAFHYRSLLRRPLSEPEQRQQERQIAAQTWGQLAFLAVLLLGNLAALLFREGRAAP